ncbi:MAG: amidohydrolase family protein, partial [Vicinamibacteria bacterium]
RMMLGLVPRQPPGAPLARDRVSGRSRIHPPLEAIQSATSVAAKAIGLGEKTGALESGRWANIIAVRGNPLEDIEALSRVSFVMVGGKRYDGLSYR